jgi:uncharacterized protein involved in response to NO
MIFGYAFAVIAGFLLTAVRAWTGHPTPSGALLAGMAVLWVVARLLAFHSPAAASITDALFALAVACGIGWPIYAGRNRNWYFVVFVLALGAGSVLYLAVPHIALTAGLDVVLLVIAVMAGRVVPGFTNNAVPGAGARRNRYLEFAALGSVVAILVLDLLGSDPWAVAFLAAAAHAARLALWAPLKARAKPILWILHLSYAWVVVHLLLRGLAGIEAVPGGLATHALTVGAIGGLTLGMMTRTARGHTARPLIAGGWEIAAYVLVHLAAAVRVFLPLLFPHAYVPLIIASGVLWSAAFAIFTLVYIPVLTRPRLDGQPG